MNHEKTNNVLIELFNTKMKAASEAATVSEMVKAIEESSAIKETLLKYRDCIIYQGALEDMRALSSEKLKAQLTETVSKCGAGLDLIVLFRPETEKNAQVLKTIREVHESGEWQEVYDRLCENTVNLQLDYFQLRDILKEAGVVEKEGKELTTLFKECLSIPSEKVAVDAINGQNFKRFLKSK